MECQGCYIRVTEHTSDHAQPSESTWEPSDQHSAVTFHCRRETLTSAIAYYDETFGEKRRHDVQT